MTRTMILRLFFLFSLLAALLPRPGLAESTVSIDHRTITVFRANLGLFTPAERAENAERRAAQLLPQSKEGWTSVNTTPQGVVVAIDGKPVFYLLPGDLPAGSQLNLQTYANQASRQLQLAWQETKEKQDPEALVNAWLHVLGATLALAAGLILTTKLLMKLKRMLLQQISLRLREQTRFPFGRRLISITTVVLGRTLILVSWLVALLLVGFYLIYSLNQFTLTRPAAESFLLTISNMVTDGASSFANALPGLFLAILIFLVVWVATRISTELFNSIENHGREDGLLNAHTAPATRRIVNAVLWLFAIAMAYPYLPGAHTQAFQGLSVMLGLMVSIGASGVVGQVASGVMIVYTYALQKGEYVKIAEHEGTVTELGLFVTRLRTGLGEEVALPNTFVLANVTRNFSRTHEGAGFVLDVGVTIGYDTPWRLVHQMLLAAADTQPDILKMPASYVVQTALSDFYVEYRLITHVATEEPAKRAKVASALRAAIQDEFNRHQVQIMSPHYFADPATPKIVPEGKW